MTSGSFKILTGDGKGKTTTALGLAWSWVARGLKVFMVQFLKAPDSSGEHFAAKTVAPMLTIKPMGRKGFIRKRGCIPLDSAMAELALQEGRSAMLSGRYDVIILDEVNVALYMGLIEAETLVEFAAARPENVELIFTGRYAHPDLIKAADCVLEMKKIKHHFDEGIQAKEGIEY